MNDERLRATDDDGAKNQDDERTRTTDNHERWTTASDGQLRATDNDERQRTNSDDEHIRMTDGYEDRMDTNDHERRTTYSHRPRKASAQRAVMDGAWGGEANSASLSEGGGEEERMIRSSSLPTLLMSTLHLGGAKVGEDEENGELFACIERGAE
ncbi:hypothetical protein BDN70DRAFT_939983 [Pholiota conissans]|uniref:Uncharacterized protein n=1 Tax=Pholiota conissans TaxID=109636 RepID=A0A9P5YK85_9AGAR|nr:hypothetical protein BDN70DRAFT_939983 [Pholiota conissans]